MSGPGGLGSVTQGKDHPVTVGRLLPLLCLLPHPGPWASWSRVHVHAEGRTEGGKVWLLPRVCLA